MLNINNVTAVQLVDTANIKIDTTSFDSTKAISVSTDANELKSKVKYSAIDSLIVDVAGEKVFLFKGAKIDYEDVHLEADYIVIDWNLKEVTAAGVLDTLGNEIGTPAFNQGGQEFKSKKIRYNFETKKGRITDVITQQGEGFLHGETVKKNQFDDFHIKSGLYTTCNLDHPHFAIKSNKLKLIGNEKKIVTGPAYLTIESVPTPLLIPFGFFPNREKRSSGFLFPAFGETAERGFFFQGMGWYFALSDKIDLALTSDIFTNGSYAIQSTTRYNSKYHFNGNLAISYSRNLRSERELPDYSRAEDFFITWNHAQDPKARPNSNFYANVRAGTSSFYTNNLSNAFNFLNNQLNSSINYSYRFPTKPWNLNVSARHAQQLSIKQVNITLPEIDFSTDRWMVFKRKEAVGANKWYENISVGYTFNATNSVDVADSNLFLNSTFSDSLRNGFQHSIPITTNIKVLKYFSLSPAFNLTERWYLRSRSFNYNPTEFGLDTLINNNFQRATDYNASAALTTVVYGMYQFKKGKIAAIRHVMTPSINVNYRPDFGESKFGYYRNVQLDSSGNNLRYSIFENGVYGTPAAGKFGTVGISINNNIEMKVRTNSDTGQTIKKVKVIEGLNINANYNLIADSLNLSNISLSARTTLFDRVGVVGSCIFDPYTITQDGIRLNTFAWSNKQGPLRFVNGTANVDFSINKTNQQSQRTKYSNEELSLIRLHPEDYIDFNIPYNFRVGYQLNVAKPTLAKSTVLQTINFNGELNLTQNWRISGTTFYDFKNKSFNYANVAISRDLHCWQMTLNWIPFGFQQSFVFQINAKSSLLQDLKLNKRRDFYDR